jgi:hypothetical protein
MHVIHRQWVGRSSSSGSADLEPSDPAATLLHTTGGCSSKECGVIDAVGNGYERQQTGGAGSVETARNRRG